MKQDFIDYLIENPQEIPAALRVYKEKYGQHEANRFEAAICARQRRHSPDNTKDIAEMINAGTRAIAGDGYYFGIEVLEQQQTPKEEVDNVAKMIRQETADILSNPGMSPNDAVKFGILRREIQNEL